MSYFTFTKAARCVLLGSLLSGILLFQVAQAKTCLMLYMMADSERAHFVKDDYRELLSSPAIRGDGVTMWMYFDAFNQNAPVLEDTLDAQGKFVTEPFTGSRYITFDKSVQKMRVDAELPSEEKSDSPEAIQNFLEHALEDCIVRGYNESLMLTFSGCGGGFAGFGGDDHFNSDGRKLLEENAGISGAIRAALTSKIRPDAMLDILGFDASLMQAVAAVGDYQFVAHHLLASESVVPGHGWDYSSLTGVGNETMAIDLTLDIFGAYFSAGGLPEKSPKMLSIIETEKFPAFIEAFEAFSAELLSAIQQGDPRALAFVMRARDAADVYTGVMDARTGSIESSSLDVGSFLSGFFGLCQPTVPFIDAVINAYEAYDSIFLARQVGQGSPSGTGMHILWPTHTAYESRTDLWDEVLFPNVTSASTITPNFHALLQNILTSHAVAEDHDDSSSICGQSAGPTALETGATAALILGDTGTVDVRSWYWDITADVSEAVSHVVVKYGVNYTTPLKPLLYEKGYETYDDEYLFLLYGEVQAQYKGSSAEAVWDQVFYFLTINEEETEPVFVRGGNGAFEIPALYFPDGRRDEVSNLQFLDYLFYDFEYWASKGAQLAFLSFSINSNGQFNNNLVLFVADPVKGAFAEKPREAGGMVVPITYIDSYIQKRSLTILPGGLNQRIIEWRPTYDYQIRPVKASEVKATMPDIDNILITLYASDGFDQTEARYYNALDPDTNSSECPFVNHKEDSCEPMPVTTGEIESSCPISRFVGLAFVALVVGLSAPAFLF